MKQLYLHPGLEKTGTTSLQKIFSDISLDYLGRNYKILFRKPDLFTKFRRIVLEQPPCWWSSKNGIKFAKSIDKSKINLQFNKFNNLFISYENLISHDLFLDTNYWVKSTSNDSWTPVDHLKILLETICPAINEISLLITVRRQPEWLGSLYSQRSNRILGASQMDFETRIKSIFEEPVILPPLNLEKLIIELKQKLPINDVTLLPIELMENFKYAKIVTQWLPENRTHKEHFKFDNLNRRNIDSGRWRLRPKQTFARKSFPLYGGFVEKMNKLNDINENNSIFLSEKIQTNILNKVKKSNESVLKYAPLGLPGYF